MNEREIKSLFDFIKEKVNQPVAISEEVVKGIVDLLDKKGYDIKEDAVSSFVIGLSDMDKGALNTAVQSKQDDKVVNFFSKLPLKKKAAKEGKEAPSAENDVDKMDPAKLINTLREDAVKSVNKQGQSNMDSQSADDALPTVKTAKAKDPADGDKGDAKKDGQKDNPGEPSMVNKTEQSTTNQKAPSKNPGEPSLIGTKESKIKEVMMPISPVPPATTVPNAAGGTKNTSTPTKPDSYRVVARGITDKVMADRIAVESKGSSQEDDAQAGKWMVVVRETKFDVTAVAERAFLVNFLKGKKVLSEKEKTFIAENSKVEIPVEFKQQVLEAYRKMAEGCGWMKMKKKAKKAEPKK